MPTKASETDAFNAPLIFSCPYTAWRGADRILYFDFDRLDVKLGPLNFGFDLPPNEERQVSLAEDPSLSLSHHGIPQPFSSDSDQDSWLCPSLCSLRARHGVVLSRLS